MEFNEVVEKRASIRSYASKKFDIMEIIELIETANLAPSPGNLPILKYIVVENPETIAKIAEACQQDFVAEAPFIVVVCSNSKDCEMMYEERSDKYIKQHAGAAIENFLLKVTDMGLASCWIGAFSDFTIKTLLDIPDNVEIEAVLPVGYQPKSYRITRKKKPGIQEKRIWYEKWKNKFQLPPSKIRREDV
jgi:nitroreductase